ncbi:MAG: helix-turn-helix transcriptional regulator [Acidimicrobiia bacterium]|nr:helix-turn-helix transcriptional regulator [Acidimicrobiia bacterium]
MKGHLDVLLLAVVSDGPGHGYALISRLRDRSEGAFDLPEGTVYPALHRLERQGLLGSEWADAGGRRRRVYRVTAKGAVALAEGQQEWRMFARSVGSVLGVTA